MGNTIYASFTEPELAEKAAGALLDFGVRPDDVSLVQGHRGVTDSRNLGSGATTYIGAAPDLEETTMGRPNQFSTDSTSNLMAPSDTIGSEKDWGANPPPQNFEEEAKHGISTTSGADAAAGAVKGAAWGTGIGIVAALASLAVPGFGLIAGGGALAMAIGGVVATAGAGAAAGAVTGYLKDQGIDGHVADHYERTLRGGGALLAVTVPSGPVDEAEAKKLLEKYGASSVNAYISRGYLA
jgi:hypothetical protein